MILKFFAPLLLTMGGGNSSLLVGLTEGKKLQNFHLPRDTDFPWLFIQSLELKLGNFQETICMEARSSPLLVLSWLV